MTAMRKSSIEHDLNFIREQIQEALLNARTKQFIKLNCFPQHLFPFSDLASEYLDIDKRKYKHVAILYCDIDLLYHEWSAIMLNLLSGAHSAAARTLRWILETTLGATVAVVDGSILDNSKPHAPLSVAGFQNWLRKYDSNNRQFRLHRDKILLTLGASQAELSDEQRLYSDLCKYSHLSETSFIKRVKSGWFDVGLNTNYPLFDRVYVLALRTADYILFSIIQAFAKITQMDDQYVGFIDSYGFHNFGLNVAPDFRKEWITLRPTDLPVTWKVVKQIAKHYPDSSIFRKRS